MQEIFESSEVPEKRAILNFLLQNPTVHGKTLEFTLRKPFDVVLELAHHPTRLGVLEEVRTLMASEGIENTIANIRKVRRIFEPVVMAKEDEARLKRERRKERRRRRYQSV